MLRDNEREIARGRLFVLHNVNHTVHVSTSKKMASVKTRGRHRDTWSSDKANEMRQRAAAGGEDGCFDEAVAAEAENDVASYLRDMEARRIQSARLQSVQESEAWVAELLKRAVPNDASLGEGKGMHSYAAAYEAEHNKPFPVSMCPTGEIKAATRESVKKVADCIDADPPPLEEEEEEEERKKEAELADRDGEDWVPDEFKDMEDDEIKKLLNGWRKEVDTILAAHKEACKRRPNTPKPDLPNPPLNRKQREFSRRLLPALLKMRRARAQGLDRKACGDLLDPTTLLHLLHGPAGTGKSVLLKVLHSVMTRHHLGGLAATAYTGVAAAPLPRATTMCTISGLPPGACYRNVGDYEPPSGVATLHKFEQYAGKRDKLSVLFIDEITPGMSSEVRVRNTSFTVALSSLTRSAYNRRLWTMPSPMYLASRPSRRLPWLVGVVPSGVHDRSHKLIRRGLVWYVEVARYVERRAHRDRPRVLFIAVLLASHKVEHKECRLRVVHDMEAPEAGCLLAAASPAVLECTQGL